MTMIDDGIMRYKVELQLEDRVIVKIIHAKGIKELYETLEMDFPKWKPICIVGG